ncbi:hypothetical protein AB0478_40125 [Streptomyces sp. NPDC051917]|uniref:hypothetical protein n=1 Tax=Streptomyces sp. NPDC051917 TaxID=3154754 RepID=UPI0034555A96
MTRKNSGAHRNKDQDLGEEHPTGNRREAAPPSGQNASQRRRLYRAPRPSRQDTDITLTEIAALATVAISAVGIPAIYRQVRIAAQAARSPIAAASVTARAQHAQDRRTAQRAAFIEVLSAVRALRDADDLAQAAALFCHIVRNRDDESTVRREEAEEERSQAIDSVAEAYDMLRKAAALVTLEGPDELLGLLDCLTRIGRALIYVGQIVPPDSETERVLVAGNESVSPTRAREMYAEAEREFVAAARRYLNGDPPGLS